MDRSTRAFSAPFDLSRYVWLCCERSASSKIDFEIGSSVAIPSFPFNPPALPIGIVRTVEAIGIAGAKLIVERVRGIRIPVSAVSVAGRIRIIRVRAELAPVLTPLIVEHWGVGRIGIRGRLITVGVPVTTELVCDAVGSERIPGAI